jgi:hypothetical protein
MNDYYHDRISLHTTHRTQAVKNVIWYREEKHESQDIPNIVTFYLLHYTVHNIQFN